MSTVNEPEDDDAVGLRHGRSGPSWTEVHDWVALSGVSPTAAFLYSLLRMHVNRERGDDLVWTSTLALALLMDMSRGDKIKPYMDELVAIEAVTRIRGGLHRRNEYVVHKLPPDGWKEPTNIKDWHTRNKPRLAVLRAEEKAKRDTRRRRAKATKVQVNPVTPKRGEQAVTPKRGEQVHPKRGEPVTPKSGREPKEVEPNEVEQPPAPSEPAPAPPAVARAATNGGDESNLDDKTRELLNALVDQIAEDRGWEPTKTRVAIRAALDAKWPAEEVVTGLAEIADDPNTVGPGRLVSYLGVRQAKRAVQQDADAAAEPTPMRVLGRDTPRCRVSGHETELASNCVQCKTANLDDAAPVTTQDRQSAIAEAKAVALRTRRSPGRSRPAAQRDAQLTGLDRLNAAAQEMGVAAPALVDAG